MTTLHNSHDKHRADYVAQGWTVTDIERPAWLHVMYTDMHGAFHGERWACTFAQAEQRLADIGATYWEIGA
ncbi:MAG: hypothetical protein IPM41_06545 [Sphingomonadales bacterium]|nr:hypothetical protein [Sphingomonadales bacterium]